MTFIDRIRTTALIAVAGMAPIGVTVAQGGSGDHWKHVPQLVTSCFSDDDFHTRLSAATTAIGAEIERQEKINASAKEKFDNMDMSEKAQRMQAFMMKNPQAAMKMLQAEQAAGAGVTSALSDANETVQRLTAELDRLSASFRAALEAAAQPVRARQAALIKAKTVLIGEVQEPAFTNAADHAQYVQLIAEENAAMERACVPFFGADGSFHKWIASWRSEVTEKNISAGGSNDLVVVQMEAMGLPDGGYRSTNPLQQVSNFLGTIGKVYGVRPGRVQAKVGVR